MANEKITTTTAGAGTPNYGEVWKKMVIDEVYRMSSIHPLTSAEKAMINSLYGVKVSEIEPDDEKKSEPEEWIWVEGYKGTEHDLKCRDYQFEMNKQFDMPEGSKIEDCSSGFHFCKDLKDVYKYYKIGDENRFFRVRGLVRKKDFEECELTKPHDIRKAILARRRDKLAAKSIIFLYELTPDEVLKASEFADHVKDFTDEDKAEVLKTSYDHVNLRKTSEKLVAAGYSQCFAEYLAYDLGGTAPKTALKVATQPGLSMDMKVLMILRDHYDD